MILYKCCLCEYTCIYSKDFLHSVYLEEEFEDTKGVIRSCKLKTDNTMTKRTNNDLQNITQITKDPATRTPLKIDGTPEVLAVPVPLVAPVVLL